MFLSDTLNKRGAQYGSFRTNAWHSQRIKKELLDGLKLSYEVDPLTNDTITEALEMIAVKLSRIVNGDPYYVDNYVDIAGYAKLVVDELGGQLKI